MEKTQIISCQKTLYGDHMFRKLFYILVFPIFWRTHQRELSLSGVAEKVIARKQQAIHPHILQQSPPNVFFQPLQKTVLSSKVFSSGHFFHFCNTLWVWLLLLTVKRLELDGGYFLGHLYSTWKSFSFFFVSAR